MEDFIWKDTRWKMSQSPTHVYFVGGPFSQWFRDSFDAPCPFTGNILRFNCAEQYMMVGKALAFDDYETFNCIMSTKNPSEQKALGRQVKNFNPEKWNKIAKGIVIQGNMHKFGQNSDLREFMMSFGDKILVEGAHYDPVWGVGLAWDDVLILDKENWKGTNWLGESLMVVRTRLKNDLLCRIHPDYQ